MNLHQSDEGDKAQVGAPRDFNPIRGDTGDFAPKCVTENIQHVRNQALCGSCWAQAVVGVLNDRLTSSRKPRCTSCIEKCTDAARSVFKGDSGNMDSEISLETQHQYRLRRPEQTLLGSVRGVIVEMKIEGPTRSSCSTG